MFSGIARTFDCLNVPGWEKKLQYGITRSEFLNIIGVDRKLMENYEKETYFGAAKT